MKKVITDINELDFGKKYTYADYLNWQFEEMVELIKGKVFRMSPAPNTEHQAISRNLLIQIGNFLQQKSCKVFHAPFDVRLPLPPEHQSEDKIDTVVQPDICVICDRDKLDEKGCKGSPDWIIEILSKATANKDLKEKFEIYQHAGVKEYWIVYPSTQTVIPYRLNQRGKFNPLRENSFSKSEKIPVGIFSALIIDLEEVFED